MPSFLSFSALRKEHDDISAKSTEAEKKMKLVEMKIQDAKDNLLKLQKDMECKSAFNLLHSYDGSLHFRNLNCFFPPIAKEEELFEL